jgi:hypothetical protein
LGFTVGQLCVDVGWQGTAKYFDDMKYANIKVTDWEGKLQNGNVKPTRQSTQHTFCNNIYTFYHSSISFPYKLYTCTKRSGWNRPVFKTVTGSSVETQVCVAAGGTADTEGMEF